MAYVRDGRLTVKMAVVEAELGVNHATLYIEMMKLGIHARHAHGHPPPPPQKRTRTIDRVETRFRWTNAKLKNLKSLLDSSGKLTVTMAEAAAYLGCERSTLRRKLRGSPLAARRTVFVWTEERMKVLNRRCPQGVLRESLSKSAHALGCSIQQLRNGLRIIGARANPKSRWTAERLAALQKLIDAEGEFSISHGEACRILNCDRHSLRLGVVLLENPAYKTFDWTPSRIKQLRMLADADGVLRHPLGLVMKQLGCSEKVLRRGMKALGFTVMPRLL